MKELHPVKWWTFVFALRILFTLVLVFPFPLVILTDFYERHFVLGSILTVILFTIAITLAEFILEAVKKSPKLRRPFEK